MQNLNSEAQNYAWSWFTLHAGQRLQMVNFWLISIAFLAAAFVQAFVNDLFIVATGVSVTGLLCSVAFLRLDMRTRSLVHVGEAALRHLEVKRAEDAQEEVLELVAAADRSRTSRFDSYRYIIQGLQLAVAGMFVLATMYSIASA